MTVEEQIKMLIGTLNFQLVVTDNKVGELKKRIEELEAENKQLRGEDD